MLNEYQIKEAILERLNAASGSINTVHIHHTDGVMRGLLWALTGKDHGTYLTENVARIMDLAGIPYTVSKNGMVNYDLPNKTD